MNLYIACLRRQRRLRRIRVGPYTWTIPPGWVLTKVQYGEAPPRGPTPYPFYIPFWQKRYPLIYLLMKKRNSFHIPTLGSLVLIFM